MDNTNHTTLKEIIRKHARQVIEELKNKEQLEVDDYFDLSNLTENQWIELSIPLTMYVSCQPFDGTIFYNETTDDVFLNETATAKKISRSFSYVRNYLMTNYGIAYWRIQQEKKINGMRMIVLIADIDSNIKILTKTMEGLGWFCSRISAPKNINGMDIRYVNFDPMYQKNVGDDIRSKWKYLYHLSPSENDESILEKGLIPSCKNKLLKYPDRIYLLKPTLPYDQVKRFAGILYLQNPSCEGMYSIFKVYLDKVPNDVNFHLDPRSSDGIFTNSPIPSSAISLEGHFDCSGYKNKL